MYPELVVQHDVSTQADMFLACSSPNYIKSQVHQWWKVMLLGPLLRIRMLISYIYIKLYSLQEEYHPTDDATTEEEEESAEEDIWKQKNSLCLSLASLSS